MLSKDTRCKALKTLTDCRTKPKFILHEWYHQRAELSCLDDKKFIDVDIKFIDTLSSHVLAEILPDQENLRKTL